MTTKSRPLRRAETAGGGERNVPKWAYILLGLFLALDYTRIPSIVPLIGLLRLQMLAMLFLIVVWFRFGDFSVLRAPVVKWVSALVVLCGLGILYAPNTRAAFNMMVNIFTYLIAVIIPVATFVRTTDRVKWLFSIFALSNTFIALWAITHGGTGPGGFVSDENDCALVLNIALPIAVALASWPGQSGRARVFWVGCAVLMVIGTIATLSRGGFLGLMASAVVMVWYSRSRLKFVGSVLGAMLVLLPFASVVVPERYMAEVRSIGDSGDGTRQNRLYFWKLGLMMYKSNPILGVGAGNYPWTVSNYERQLPPDQIFRGQLSGGRVAHSVYFTLLPELGTAGLIIFASVVGIIIRTGRQLRISRPRRGRGRGAIPQNEPSSQEIELDIAGRTLIASCVAYLATGAFISVLYYPSLWHLAGFAMALGLTQKALKSGAGK